MPKNIWVINQFAGNPESGWGERHYYLSKKWLKDGYDVKIISGSFNHMFSRLPETNGQFTLEKYEGTQFCWVKSPTYDPKSIMRFLSMIIFSFKVLFLPKNKLGKPDVIVVSSMPIFPILSGWILKKIHGAEKLIFEIRDIWPLTIIHLRGITRWHPLAMFIGFFEKFGYRRSDFVVSLLPNAHKHINAITKNIDKIKIIPNGISESLLKEEQLPNEVADLIPNNKFLIGYTGTISLANALEFLVDAARLCIDNKEINFVLVGSGYLKKELQKQCTDLDNIIFIPKIRKDQVQSILRLFDVCFIGRNDTPLFDHGVSSNKYFDYMLAGKPVIVSSNRIKDPVELSGCGLIVKPESAEAIKTGLLHLYKMSEKERLKLGIKGIEYVKLYHTYDKLSDKYKALF